MPVRQAVGVKGGTSSFNTMQCHYGERLQPSIMLDKLNPLGSALREEVTITSVWLITSR